jgi:hypothetical protein
VARRASLITVWLEVRVLPGPPRTLSNREISRRRPRSRQLASVATVWLARGDHSYLLDLWRERVDYPELRRAVSRLREKYAGAALLVEDKGSGTSLIQDLRAENRAVIRINPEGDKLTRAAKTWGNSRPARYSSPRLRLGSQGSRPSYSVFPMSGMTIRSIRLHRRYPGSHSAGRTKFLLLRRSSFRGPARILATCRETIFSLHDRSPPRRLRTHCQDLAILSRSASGPERMRLTSLVRTIGRRPALRRSSALSANTCDSVPCGHRRRMFEPGRWRFVASEKSDSCISMV